jgi:cardiolipin synthase
VLILPSGPADELETASLLFVHAIHSARRMIWISSPYFLPDPPVLAALQIAGLRGVEVRVLITDEVDHLGAYLAAYSYFDDSERTGVKVYRYLRGFLHLKALLIDNSVAAVGTANLDNRSLRLNFEITAIVFDTAFASQVERMLLTDVQNSRQMAPHEAAGKP